MIIGIIGGSGLYEIQGLKKNQEKKWITPLGSPSDRFLIGELGAHTFVFLPRHGRDHTISPSEINYRANILGMKQLGVEIIFSVSAVGSMKEEIYPGDIVIVDQFIDWTKGIRKHTFFEKGCVGHISFAYPICQSTADVAYRAAQKITSRVHPKGTYICIEGPQFSTRAESLLYRSFGVDVIGMTNVPECKLAREAGICYAALALSTDYDCWREGEEAVSVNKVLQTLKKNVETAKKIIQEISRLISSKKRCECREASKAALVTDFSKTPAKTKMILKFLRGTKS